MRKGMKKCSGCQEDLPLTEFYKNKRMNDGHSIYCVSCTKENSRKYHQRKKNRLKVSHNEEVVKNMVLNNPQVSHPHLACFHQGQYWLVY